MTWNRTTVTILDGNGQAKTFIAYTDGTSYSFAHPLLDSTGAALDPATSELQSSILNSSQQNSGLLSYSATGGSGNSLITTTPIAIKGAPGQLNGAQFYNPNATIAWIQIFDLTTSNITLGTTPPKFSFEIPAQNQIFLQLGGNVAFNNAISMAATTTATGSIALSTGLTANISYK